MWLSRCAPVVVAMAMAVALPAMAAEPPAAAPKTVASPGKDARPKEKLVCTTEPVIGKLVPERVCRTAQQTKDDRETVEEIQRNRQGSGGALIGDRSLSGPLSGAGTISATK
jgi:hypothetical protein